MMSTRSTIALVLTACLATTLNLAQGQTATPNSKPEDQVMQLERNWLAADGSGDLASLRRIISDDFIGSSFDGQILSKHDIVPEQSGRGGFAGATPSNTNVRVFGDTAVLMGVINMAGTPPKQIHVTLVCQKRSQGWQMIAAELTHAQ
jgi:ketosteroid isomerase-like protein